MEVWYRAYIDAVYCELISRRDFTRSTDKMLISDNGRKEAKETTWYKYFLTWDEAKAFIVEEAEKRVRYAEQDLERKRESLAKFQALTNPEVGG